MDCACGIKARTCHGHVTRRRVAGKLPQIPRALHAAPPGGEDILTRVKNVQTTRASAGTFRLFLQTELARRCARNARFSLRSFAQQLRIDHSTLSQMLRGRRAMTARTIETLGRRLKLSDGRINAFVEAEAVAGAPAPVSPVRQLAADAAEVVADPRHFAILELTHVAQFRADTRWVARVLGCTADEVNVALQRLLRLKLMAMPRADRWVDLCADASADLGEFEHVVVRRLAEQARQWRLSADARVPATLRSFSSSTIAVSTRRLGEAMALIARLRRDLTKLMSSADARDDVYQLEVGLYPVTTLSSKPKEQ